MRRCHGSTHQSGTEAEFLSLLIDVLPCFGQVIDTPSELCAEGSSQSMLLEPRVEASTMIRFFQGGLRSLTLFGKWVPWVAAGNMKVRPLLQLSRS